MHSHTSPPCNNDQKWGKPAQSFGKLQDASQLFASIMVRKETTRTYRLVETCLQTEEKG